MKKNALSRGKPEFAAIASEVLLERFPVNAKRRSGPTPTTVKFQSVSKEFASGKAAYLWLVGEFVRFRANSMEGYLALHTRAGPKSRGRRFAKNPTDLFPVGSTRSGNAAHYSKLFNSWYADTNLNHDDKFATLLQLSAVCNLEYRVDWDFRVSGATEQLLDHQATIDRSRKLLDELLAL